MAARDPLEAQAHTGSLTGDQNHVFRGSYMAKEEKERM